MSTEIPENDPEQYDDYSVDDEDQLQPEDTLADDDVDDTLDRGYSPPEGYSPAQTYGTTPWEQAHDRPLDDRLAEEEPEPDPLAEADVNIDDMHLGHSSEGKAAMQVLATTPEVPADLQAAIAGMDGILSVHALSGD